jgi:hypothetical protein
MDDFNVSSLHESKNECVSRLISILTPLIIDGCKSILDESIKLCRDNNENEKYLMTFQNLISRIPKWNAQIIETERKRICEKSGCNHLEDLITCVHIIMLKILTAVRVGQKQKKININIPDINDFIHRTYINVARKIYKTIYLFEVNIQPLQIQKNYRELEIIVQECILNTVRESIPVEAILMAYMDETIEEDVIEEVKEEITEQPIKDNCPIDSIQHTNLQEPNIHTPNLQTPYNKLNFSNIDYIKTDDGTETNVFAPKSISVLEEISKIRSDQRKMESDDFSKLNISNESFNLNTLDVHNIEEPNIELLPDLLIDNIEILD